MCTRRSCRRSAQGDPFTNGKGHVVRRNEEQKLVVIVPAPPIRKIIKKRNAITDLETLEDDGKQQLSENHMDQQCSL